MHTWQLVSSLGTISMDGGLNQRNNRPPNVLGKVGPCGGNSEQVVILGHQVPVAGTTGGTTPLKRFDRISSDGGRTAVFRPWLAARHAGGHRFKSCIAHFEVVIADWTSCLPIRYSVFVWIQDPKVITRVNRRLLNHIDDFEPKTGVQSRWTRAQLLFEK